MLTEALSLLFDLKARSTAPVEVPVGDPRKKVFAIDGEIKEFAVNPAPRDHGPGTLADLIALANRFAETGPAPSVWYDFAHVVLVIDDAGNRIEHASLTLTESDVYTRIVRLRKEAPLDPKRFVRLLRVDLAGTLTPEALLNRVKSIRFDAGTITTAENARQRESMGRTITAKVEADQGADIPEAVSLAAPVYKTPGETDRYPLRCAVEVDAMEGTLQLIPLPDEIERVRQMAVESIGKRLGDGLTAGIPFYQGQP